MEERLALYISDAKDFFKKTFCFKPPGGGGGVKSPKSFTPTCRDLAGTVPSPSPNIVCGTWSGKSAWFL